MATTWSPWWSSNAVFSKFARSLALSWSSSTPWLIRMGWLSWTTTSSWMCSRTKSSLRMSWSIILIGSCLWCRKLETGFKQSHSMQRRPSNVLIGTSMDSFLRVIYARACSRTSAFRSIRSLTPNLRDFTDFLTRLRLARSSWPTSKNWPKIRQTIGNLLRFSRSASWSLKSTQVCLKVSLFALSKLVK